jgi:hypothetical protein
MCPSRVGENYFRQEKEGEEIMSKKKLSDTQKNLLERLAAGERLARTRMGPWTGPFKFKGDKTGINSATIQKLRSMKLLEVTGKMTMYGLTEYCHIPDLKPWDTDSSHTSYVKSLELQNGLHKYNKRR